VARSGRLVGRPVRSAFHCAFRREYCLHRWFHGTHNQLQGEAKPCDSRACGEPQNPLGALLGACAAELAPLVPDLARLLTAWGALPDAIKKAIAAMVEASTVPAESGRR